MAIPVFKGLKTPNERFAGALETYCIEALMQDGRALQVGTSHFLGQKIFLKHLVSNSGDKKGDLQYVWGTSWGVSTRLMGALIMSHGDKKGLIIPPKLAPIQIVIIPVFKSRQEFDIISNCANTLKNRLEKKKYSIQFDDRDTHKPGFKFAEWEMKGVPLRIVIGPEDIANNSIEICRRDTGEKKTYNMDSVQNVISELLKEIQHNMYQKALQFRKENTHYADSFQEFKRILMEKQGFILAHWDGSSQTEEKIKLDTKATIRAIPLNSHLEAGKCIFSGKSSNRRVLFAKAY